MTYRLLNGRTVLIVIGISLQLAWYGLLAAQTFADLSVLKQIDYIAFYTGGYIARFESPAQEYNLELQERVERQAVLPLELRRFYPYNHPPILIHVLAWSTTRDYTTSFFRWILCLFVFQLASLFVLARSTQHLGWRTGQTWILVLSGLFFYPLMTAYLKGQDSAFLLLAFSLWFHGLLKGDDRLSGFGLALALLRPQLALPLALPFLFNRRKVFAWFALGSLLLLAYAALSIGPAGLRDLGGVLVFSGAGRGFDLDKMSTLTGAVVRAFPAAGDGLLHLIGYGGAALVALGLCYLWSRSQTLDHRHAGSALLLTMLASPHLHNHDLSLWLIPAVGVSLTLAASGRLALRNALLVPLCLSLILMLNGIVQFGAVHYLLAAAMLALLWISPIKERELP